MSASMYPARPEPVGATQYALIYRARGDSGGAVMDRDNAEHCAARRLVQRGLLERSQVHGPDTRPVRIWKLTERGRNAWLVVR